MKLKLVRFYPKCSRRKTLLLTTASSETGKEGLLHPEAVKIID